MGLHDAQPLQHFLTDSPWSVLVLRDKRLELTLKMLKRRYFKLVIDETGDKKKGKHTDYVARQYIGNLGKVENGIVSVNAYGVLGDLLKSFWYSDRACLFMIPCRFSARFFSMSSPARV